MTRTLCIEEFIHVNCPTLDVRSPGEFKHGHIPGSYSFPLFSDEERSIIGTAYKQQSREEAIDLGLDFFTHKVEGWLDKIPCFLSSLGKVLCWRGGMRSGFVARLIEALGYQIFTLEGGYKSFRHWILQTFETIGRFSFCLLGGLTGSGKTTFLNQLKNCGEQIIDLESIANHRGSSFGGLGLCSQPTQEQFENQLALELQKLDPTKDVWIEDESRLIGRCCLPKSLYLAMQKSPLYFIECSKAIRIKRLLDEYSVFSSQELVECTKRIAKRLGSQLTSTVQQLICEGKIEQALERLLSYYDDSYLHHTSKRKTVYKIDSI